MPLTVPSLLINSWLILTAKRMVKMTLPEMISIALKTLFDAHPGVLCVESNYVLVLFALKALIHCHVNFLCIESIFAC